MRGLTALLIAALVGVVAAGGTGRAADPTPAERLHEAALAAHEKRRMRQAIELWRDALKLERNWKYAYNLANTLYEIEDGQAAWDALADVDAIGPPEKYVAIVIELRSKVRALLYKDHAWLALDVKTPGAWVRRDGVAWSPPYEVWVKAAESTIEVSAPGFETLRETVPHAIGQRTERRIELRTAQIAAPTVGTLRVEGTPAGARVTVGGIDRGVLPLAPLELEPGPVQVRVSAPGRAAEERTVMITSGRETPVVVELALATPKEGPNRLATPGWITLASGVVLAAVGTGFYAWADATADDIERLNTDRAALAELAEYPVYQRRYDDLRHDFDQRALTGQILLGVGGAAVVTGLTLVLLDRSGATEPGTGDVHVVPTSGGALIVGGASF